jgi:hypothetical protein
MDLGVRMPLSTVYMRTASSEIPSSSMTTREGEEDLGPALMTLS